MEGLADMSIADGIEIFGSIGLIIFMAVCVFTS